MNILITGNSGYVGSLLVPYLKKKYPKYHLYGFDTGYFFQDFLKYDKLPESYLENQVFSDIRNRNINLPKKIDTVIHLASLSNDPLGNINKKLTKDINIDGSKNLIKYLKKINCKKFIFASSCSVYGFSNNIVNENSKVNPLTAYAVSKVKIENYLKKQNFNSISLRFATACGFSSRMRFDLVLNDFVLSAILNKKIEILSDGRAFRPLIDVNDMCTSIDWAIHKSLLNTNYETYNVGKSSNNIRIIELAKIVKNLVPGCKIKFSKNKNNDNRSYMVDFSKFTSNSSNILSFSIEKSVKNIIKNLEKNISLDKNFRNSNYLRLNKINFLIKNNYLNKSLYWKL